MPIIISILNAQEDIPAWQKAESDAKPALKCLEFSDGTLAVIGKVDNCTGSYETISWFISKGYHIAGIGADTGNYWYDVFLTR